MDAEYLADAARGVWHYVSRGNACELAYTPGNGTLYELVFTGVGSSGLSKAADWMDHRLARSIVQDRPELNGDGWLILSWIGHGAWPIDLRSVWFESYIAEKFGCTDGDATAIRALLLAIADTARLRPVAVLR